MLDAPSRFLFVFFGIETAFQTRAWVCLQVRLLQRTGGTSSATRCVAVPVVMPTVLLRKPACVDVLDREQCESDRVQCPSA